MSEETNGTARPVRFDYPPVAPPAAPLPPREIKEDREEEQPSYSWGFIGDLVCWWRTRRERQLIERIRSLEQQLALKEEENLQLAGMLERISRWNLASTQAAVRVEEQMRPHFGPGIAAPPQRPSK